MNKYFIFAGLKYVGILRRIVYVIVDTNKKALYKTPQKPKICPIDRCNFEGCRREDGGDDRRTIICGD